MNFFNKILFQIQYFLTSMSGALQLVFLNVSWLILEKLFRSVTTIAVSIVLARYFGPELFGIFSFAQALVAILVFIAGLGLRSLVVRDLIMRPDEAGKILGTVLCIHLIVGIACFGFLWLISPVLLAGNHLAQVVTTIIGTAMLFKASDVASYWFESQVQAKYLVLTQCMVGGIFVPLKFICIIYGLDLKVIAMLFALESALMAIAVMTSFNFFGKLITELSMGWGEAKRLLRDGWPLMISAAGIIIALKIDLVMLGYIRNDVEVGLYSASVKISEAWYFVIPIVVSSIFPMLTKLHNTQNLYFETYLLRLYGFMFWFAVGIGLLIFLISPFLVDWIFGSEFSGASILLQIHIWGGIVVAVGTVWSRWLLLENKQQLAVYGHATSAISNVVLNWILIPQYGATGAAVATILSYITSLIVNFNVWKPSYTLNIFLEGIFFEPLRLLKIKFRN